LQLVQGNDAKRVAAEQWAISMVRGKITQKYDVTQEFTDTLPWSATKTYNVRDRVIIDYVAYDPTKTYALNTCVIQAGNGYVCSTAITIPEAFTIGHWTLLGPQYSIYYTSYPPACTYQGLPNPATLANPYAPEFALIDIANGGDQRLYNEGDIVFWKGYTYAAVIGTILINESQLIQYISYANVPYLNVFPDDIVNNAQNQFWGTKTAYVVAAGTLPTNATFWTLGDNRTPEIMECVKDMTIYKLSALLNFRRAEWDDKYTSACDLLRMYANGTATLLMPLKSVPRGTRARYGGHIKSTNIY